MSEPIRGKDWEKRLSFLAVLTLGIGRALERMVRELKVPGAHKSATVFLPVSWLFTIMAETRSCGFVCLFRGLHSLELKVRDFSGVPCLGCKGAGLLN